MKRNKILEFLTFIACISAIVVILHIIIQSSEDNDDDDVLARILYYIQTLYVDKVDARRLADVAIRAMLNKLNDPHSTFHDAESAQRLEEPMRGSTYGIGIAFEMFADTLYIWDIAHDSSAQKAGLMSGDRIIYINDTLVAGVQMNRAEIENRLSGERGASKDLKVLRRDVPDLMNFQVITGSIPVRSVTAAYMVADSIGYIRLNIFSRRSAEEFIAAVNELQEQGMVNLIFDLTYNGGGDLGNVYDIANEFLERERRVYFFRSRDDGIRNWIARHAGSMHTGNLVVLVNERSMSGSEMFAGAMQDWDRGVIVGRRTYGKGTAQRWIPLDDGSMLRLTSGEFFTPIGRSVRKFGYDCEEEAFNRNVEAHILTYKISAAGVDVPDEWVHQLDSAKFTTLVNKRRLIGGGGIFPDYVVPENTIRTGLFNNLGRNGIFWKIAISKVDNNRNELLKRYPDAKTFKANYQLPPIVIRRLRQMAEEAEIEWNNQQFEASRSLILTRIKAYMARDLYSPSAFNLIMTKENEIFQAGLRIISDPEKYENLLKGIGAKSVLQVPIDEYNYTDIEQ